MAPPQKQPNALRRNHEHLMPPQIERLIAAARQLGRHRLVLNAIVPWNAR